MNVKVNYTVDLEEIPSLVQDMLNSCLQDLAALSNTKLNTFDAESLINEVISIRRRLSLLDARLEDSTNIIAGYHNAKSGALLTEPANQEETENEKG